MPYNYKNVAIVVVIIILISAVLCLFFIPRRSVIKDPDVAKIDTRPIVTGAVTADEDQDVSEIQGQRQELLSEACDDYMPPGDSNSPVSLQDTMSINTAKRFMYCKITSVATSSADKNLARSHLEPSNGTVYNETSRQRLPLYPVYRRPQQRRMLRNYFSFLFVRHPYERLVSVWQNKFVEMDYYNKHEEIRFKRNIELIKVLYRSEDEPESNVLFREFIRFVIDTRESDPIDVHWRPYYKLCRPCSVQYDFIGHYETVRQDANHLITQLGLHVPKYPSMHSIKTYPGFVAEQMATLTKKQLRKLKEIYRFDFLLFGYSIKLGLIM